MTVTWNSTLVGAPSCFGGRIRSYSFGFGISSENSKDDVGSGSGFANFPSPGFGVEFPGVGGIQRLMIGIRV